MGFLSSTVDVQSVAKTLQHYSVSVNSFAREDHHFATPCRVSGLIDLVNIFIFKSHEPPQLHLYKYLESSLTSRGIAASEQVQSAGTK